MERTAREVRENTLATFFNGLLLMDTPMLAEQEILRFISFIWIQYTALTTCSDQWTIGTHCKRERERERVSGIVPSVNLHVDNNE